jgi:hypothetical protein
MYVNKIFKFLLLTYIRNLRGINNNAWHRVNLPVVKEEEEEEA